MRSANLALKTLSRCLGVAQTLDDAGKLSSVELSDKDLQKAASCHVEMLRTGKNLIVCSLFDFEFLQSTISQQKRIRMSPLTLKSL